MRTTINMDDDLLRELRQKAHETGGPFKEAINKTLRAGLRSPAKKKASKPYKCKSHSLGYPPKADINRALDLTEHLESEEKARKLLSRK